MNRAASLIAVTGLLLLGAVDGWLWSRSAAGIAPVSAGVIAKTIEPPVAGLASRPLLSGAPRRDLMTVRGSDDGEQTKSPLPLLDAALYRLPPGAPGAFARFSARALGPSGEEVPETLREAASAALLLATVELSWDQPAELRAPIPPPPSASKSTGPRAGPWFVTLEFEPGLDRSGGRQLQIEALLRDDSGGGRLHQGLRARLPFPQAGRLLLVLPDPYAEGGAEGRGDILWVLLEARPRAQSLPDRRG